MEMVLTVVITMILTPTDDTMTTVIMNVTHKSAYFKKYTVYYLEFRALVKEGKYVYEDVLLKFAAYEINSDHVKTENDVTKKLIQEIQEVQGKKAIQENKLNQINTCEEAAAFNAEQKKLNYNNTRSRSNITNEENCEKRTSILVTGLTTAMNKEYLELFFESEQECGGGDLDYTWPVDIDEVNKRAIVTFQDDSG